MNFDNEAEEMFYDFLNDYELTSMIKKIDSQVWIDTFTKRRRIDFILTLTNGRCLLVETDGKMHNQPKVMIEDWHKEYSLRRMGLDMLRIKFVEFFNDPTAVANKIEGMIDLMGSETNEYLASLED